MLARANARGYAVVAAMAMAALVAGCDRPNTRHPSTDQNHAPEPGHAVIGKPAPDFSVQNRAGGTVTLSALKGKVVLVDFWATWCGPCRMTIPGLIEMHQKYGDKGLVVLGLTNEKSDVVAKFAREKGIPYTLCVGTESEFSNYEVDGIPSLWLIGPDGVVVDHVVGFDEGAERGLAEKVATLVAKVTS